MSLPFRKLGLGGGGVKGILHIGALRELAKYQPLEFSDGIYGCSIGSIVAAYVSFGLPIDDKLVELTKKHLSSDKIIPNLSFKNITSGIAEKGVFAMDLFKENLYELFNECGVDIRTKKISDAKMPLYIIASNITKGIPTIFTGDVLVIDALCCSCCMPGIFRPQEMYDQLYVDGDLFVPNIGSLHKDALVPVSYTHLTLPTID
jgi:NTE family protein